MSNSRDEFLDMEDEDAYDADDEKDLQDSKQDYEKQFDSEDEP